MKKVEGKGLEDPIAHVACAMSARRLDGPVLGICFGQGSLAENTGCGGGDVFLLDGDAASAVHLATLRPIVLAGGGLVDREIWRFALAVVEDAFKGSSERLLDDGILKELELFKAVPPGHVDFVRSRNRKGGRTTTTHAAARWLDAVAALALARPETASANETARDLQAVADLEEAGLYPVRFHATQSPWELDFRPSVREVVADVTAGTDRGRIVARFVNTLARVTAMAVHELIDGDEVAPIALTGDAFRFPLLKERLVRDLRARPWSGDVPEVFHVED